MTSSNDLLMQLILEDESSNVKEEPMDSDLFDPDGCSDNEEQMNPFPYTTLARNVPLLTSKSRPEPVKIYHTPYSKANNAVGVIRVQADQVATASNYSEKLFDLLNAAKCAVVYIGEELFTWPLPVPKGDEKEDEFYRKREYYCERLSQPKIRDATKTIVPPLYFVLKELYRIGKVKHFVTQSTDGKLLRAGIPQIGVTEMYGNVHIEICASCNVQYIRPFDVTGGAIKFDYHGTGRFCQKCGQELVDTISRYSEVREFLFPHNWAGYNKVKENMDLLICIGVNMDKLAEFPSLVPSVEAKVVLLGSRKLDSEYPYYIETNNKPDIIMNILARMMKLPVLPYCRHCDPLYDPSCINEDEDLTNNLFDCKCFVGVHLRSVVITADNENQENGNVPDELSEAYEGPGNWVKILPPTVLGPEKRYPVKIVKKDPCEENDEWVIRDILAAILLTLDPRPTKIGRPGREVYITSVEKDNKKFEAELSRKRKLEEEEEKYDESLTSWIKNAAEHSEKIPRWEKRKFYQKRSEEGMAKAPYCTLMDALTKSLEKAESTYSQYTSFVLDECEKTDKLRLLSKSDKSGECLNGSSNGNGIHVNKKDELAVEADELYESWNEETKFKFYQLFEDYEGEVSSGTLFRFICENLLDDETIKTGQLDLLKKLATRFGKVV